MSVLELIGLMFFSPSTVFKKVISSQKENWLQTILLVLITFIPLAYIMIYAELGDFSELSLQLKLGSSIHLYGIEKLSLIGAFFLFFGQTVLGMWIIPTIIFRSIHQKDLKKSQSEESTIPYFYFSALGFVPFLLVENICMLIILNGEKLLTSITTVADFAIMGTMLLALFYYLAFLVAISTYSVNAKGKGWGVKLGRFFLALVLIVITLGVFYLV